MPIRRQTLEEWFLDYQLRKLHERYAVLPGVMVVDLGDLATRWHSSIERLPITAMVIKAAGLLLKRHPEANRTLIRGLLGTRVVQFDEANVIAPIYMTFGDRRILSATVIRRADELSLVEIHGALKQARKRPLGELPIARRLLTRSNNVVARAELKAIHFASQRIPSFFLRFGGAITVTSVLRPRRDSQNFATLAPHGPTTFTIAPSQVIVDPSTKGLSLHLGVGFEHCGMEGYRAVRIIDDFSTILGHEVAPLVRESDWVGQGL